MITVTKQVIIIFVQPDLPLLTFATSTLMAPSATTVSLRPMTVACVPLLHSMRVSKL